MLQSLATLVFAAAAVSALMMIAALMAAEWPHVLRALGLIGDGGTFTPPARIRVMQARRVPILRVTPGALRRAA